MQILRLERRMLEEVKGSTKEHQELVKKCLLWLSVNRPWVCWSNTTGNVRTDTGRYIKFGLKGSSDIIGISDTGKFICIEVKTGKSRVSKEQKAFLKMAYARGAMCYILRSGASFELVFA